MKRGWALFLAVLVCAVAIGVWQAEAIKRFRRPGVDQTVAMGQPTVLDGVRFQLTGFRHGDQLPVTPQLRDSRDSDMVSALPGAELVQVVLTVTIEDPKRSPDSILCDVTLQDSAGRSWRADGTVDYLVAGPSASTCTGAYEKKPKAGQPYEVGQVFQLPADAVSDVSVRVEVSGGSRQQLLELRPR